jgi:hypothetical protein
MSGNNKKLISLPGEALEKSAANVLERVLGATTDGSVALAGNIFGGLIGDRVREWRTRNLINALSKTAEHLHRLGVKLEDARALPMGEAYQMFDGCSQVDDPTLQDMWSLLLASSLNPNRDGSYDKAYSEILGRMTPFDARLLHAIAFCWFDPDRIDEYKSEKKFLETFSEKRKHLIDWLNRVSPLEKNEESKLVGIATQRLLTMNLISPIGTITKAPIEVVLYEIRGTMGHGRLVATFDKDRNSKEPRFSHEWMPVFIMSQLGSGLADACFPDMPKWIPPSKR